MDITGIDIGALTAAIGAILKSLHSDRKATNSERELKERVALVEQRQGAQEKRLDDGDYVIRELKNSLSDIRGDVRYIKGVLDGKIDGIFKEGK